jgi:hypothetical protein
MWEHLNVNNNRHLRFAINKYGWDNLVKSQLLIAEEDYCLEIEKKLRHKENIGWNIVVGGGMPPSSLGKKYNRTSPSWNKGLAWSDDVKEKVRVGVTELWKDPEYRQHMSDVHKGQTSPMAGKKHSQETIAKMSASKIGKPSKKKGKPLSAEAVEKMKAKYALNPWTCPHCGKIGKNMGTGTRWHFNNCKEKGLV